MNEQQFQSPHQQSPFPPYPGYPADSVPAKQSGLGIASFVLGIVSILAFVICLLVATSSIMDYISDDSKVILDVEDVSANVTLILSVLMMFGSLGLSFIGLILGIIGACMKNRRKAFAIVGIVLNALLVVGTGALMLLGAVSQSAL
ncbi:hypothetical protein [Paenibacillus sp. GCM10027626]|uniref:hypothetical protein n=1 Tax=Paenibacillus sp. GCM10027626 TaxID=3273411 RepID=UPI0036356E86